jgi:hypothetical protein
MSRPRIPIAGLLVAMAILAVVLSILNRPSQTLPNLWNLAVWTIPPIGILSMYGSERCRAGIRSLVVGLARGLVLLAASGLILAGLGLLLAVVLGVLLKITLLNNLVASVLGSTALAMAFATRWAFRGRGLRRAFGAGAAACGWPFLFLGLAPVLSERVPVLWSTELLHAAYPHLYVTAFPEPEPPEPTLGASRSGTQLGLLIFKSVSLNYLQFQLIGHCLVSLGFAMAGGLLARALAAGRNAPAVATADESSPAHLSSSGAAPFGAILGTPGQALSGRNS